MKKKPSTHSDSREHKDITCAVRLPQSMYSQLSEVANMTNSSLSDIMRDAIVEKIEKIKEELIQKKLKRAEIVAKVKKLGLASKSKSNDEIAALLDLLEAS